MDSEHLRRQLEAAGLTVDGETLDALMPVYSGVLNGARRLAALDLGEREPALTFRHPPVRREVPR